MLKCGNLRIGDVSNAIRVEEMWRELWPVDVPGTIGWLTTFWQTLEDSFSAVSKPKFATEYSWITKNTFKKPFNQKRSETN